MAANLVLVPGSGCDGRLFAAQIDALQGTFDIHVVENVAAIPDAELVVPGSGHLTALETPDAVTAALRQWLHRVLKADPSTPRTAP